MNDAGKSLAFLQRSKELSDPEDIEEASVLRTLATPPYPSVQGQVVPDMNLAGISTPKTSLAGGNFADSTPPQNISVPPLSCSDPTQDMYDLGIDPAVNYFQLNLAGNAINIPSPASLAAPADGQSTINLPTFGEQNYTVPPNKPFSLTAPGIDWIAPLLPDPQVPDLTSPAQAKGIFIIASRSDPMAIDPVAPDLSLYDRPAGLAMPGPLMVDPLHPDLQNPQDTQDVMMRERPADLDGRALTIMHADPTYSMEPAQNYEELWMAQAGNNQTRERHLGMLQLGLDREEK